MQYPQTIDSVIHKRDKHNCMMVLFSGRSYNAGFQRATKLLSLVTVIKSRLAQEQKQDICFSLIVCNIQIIKRVICRL